MLLGPHGNSPCCGVPLERVTFGCGWKRGGSHGGCLVLHPGLRCTSCQVVYQSETILKRAERPINVRSA